jgi:hypothetical protein
MIPEAIVVWVCPTCGYWRQDRSTGEHVEANPEDPRGKYLTHRLVERVYTAALSRNEESR